MNDLTLRQLVLDELEFEPSIDAADIGVAVDDGVVTLTGHVSDYLQKLTAEQAAWRVKGVRAIAQNIEARIPGHARRHDDEIAQRAADTLAWSSMVPAGAIEVRVSAGGITLIGQVNWHFQRESAEREVRKLSGVVGVSNEITLKTGAKASDVRQKIVAALQRNAEVEAGRIRVEVGNGDTIRLEGEVDNPHEHQAVRRAVWSAPGVRMIDDHLRIA